MTTPHDNPSDLSARQSAELIRDLLDTKHPQSYVLFSLDRHYRGHAPYRKELFHNRVCLFFLAIFHILSMDLGR